ncbi:hypothetical protein KT71_003279 [Congregibacter litoralis KT71]|uniref:Uncharacterized protein n=1 Tax=Congregibacter litoralis KT71 TaxID=314285 RepID=V7HUY5_9GAMM|nr:hypothetical protein KT71_003279 [Congregibacter litoralis KT71]
MKFSQIGQWLLSHPENERERLRSKVEESKLRLKRDQQAVRHMASATLSKRVAQPSSLAASASLGFVLAASRPAMKGKGVPSLTSLLSLGARALTLKSALSDV